MVTCKNDIYSWTSWCVCKCTDRIQKYCDPHSLHICRNNVRTQSTEHYKLHLVIFLQKTFPGNAHKKSANALLLWQIKKARKRESYRFTRLIHSHRAIAMYLTGQHWKDRNPAKQSNQISELRDENEMITMWRKNQSQSCHRNAAGVQNHMANEPHRT